MAAPPPPSAVAELKNDPDITVLDLQGQNIGVLGFNVEHQPLGDVRVRMALAKAVDRKAIVEAVYQGAGSIAGSVVPPAQLGAVKDTGIEYDPDGAKKLLKESGHESGLSINLWAMPVSRPYNPNARRMAEMIQADWAAVGVKSEIVTYDWSEYLKRTAAGEHDAFLLGGSSDNGDPDNMLSYLLSCDGVKGGSNRSRWCDPAFEKLLQEGRVTADPEKRADIYRQGAGDPEDRGTGGADRPFGGVDPDAQERAQLCARSVRPAEFRRRRYRRMNPHLNRSRPQCWKNSNPCSLPTSPTAPWAPRWPFPGTRRRRCP